MWSQLTVWLSLSVAGGAVAAGAFAAMARASWLIAHGNTAVLLPKPLQLFVIIGGYFFVAAAVWGAPVIVLWVLAVRRRWPRFGHSPVASVLGPSLAAGAMAAATWPAVSDLPLWLPAAVCGSIAAPPLLLSRLRTPGERTA